MYRRLVIAALFLLSAALSATVPATAHAASDWIISAEAAKKKIESGQATVLDTRGRSDWKKGHAPGAQPVRWQDFSRSQAPHKGRLVSNDKLLTKKLQKLGVSKNKPVLVVGKPPQNWGEDGRIVWMLRTLGHPKAALVNGGHRALQRAGLKMVEMPSKPSRGDFVVERTNSYDIERDTLRKRFDSDKYVLVDTREEREYEGATPYGESRGGHVPGAKHLHYTELMGKDGQLLPAQKLRKKLAERGITPDKRVVAYCTGGVRSAWLVAVLADLGFPHVANYAGSMWEWSAGEADKYPLETD